MAYVSQCMMRVEVNTMPILAAQMAMPVAQVVVDQMVFLDLTLMFSGDEAGMLYALGPRGVADKISKVFEREDVRQAIVEEVKRGGRLIGKEY